jgi:hypothetical protein
MSEGQAETTQVVTPAAEPTPAQAIAVAEKPEVAAPTTATTTEAAKPQTGETQPKGKDFYIKLRHQEREAEKKAAADRISELEQKLSQFEGKPTPQPKTPEHPNKPPSLLDDPDGYAAWVREDTLRGIKEDQQKREAEANVAKQNELYRQSADESCSWLLSQSHIKQDAALVKEVGALLDGELAQAAFADPKAAMELAYIRVCRQKGIDPFATGNPEKNLNATKGAATSGARPSAPVAGKRVFQPGEAKAYLRKFTPGTKEHDAAVAEVDEAYNEGRVKR